jgi:hypothetical protein
MHLSGASTPSNNRQGESYRKGLTEMERHEMKARVGAQIDEWQRNLKLMRAKLDESTGEAKVDYQERLADLEQGFNDYKIRAAQAWDSGDDKWDESRRNLELTWDEWMLKAKRAWQDLIDRD